MPDREQTPLTERLRDYPDFFLNGAVWMMSTQKSALAIEAADEIDRLELAMREKEAECEKLLVQRAEAREECLISRREFGAAKAQAESRAAAAEGLLISAPPTGSAAWEARRNAFLSSRDGKATEKGEQK